MSVRPEEDKPTGSPAGISSLGKHSGYHLTVHYPQCDWKIFATISKHYISQAHVYMMPGPYRAYGEFKAMEEDDNLLFTNAPDLSKLAKISSFITKVAESLRLFLLSACFGTAPIFR